MKKNFAVIGYGGQGAWHTRQILSSEVAALTGVYDIDPAKNALAEKNGIHAYSSFEEVLADSAVETVVIAVPNDDHKELVVKSLEAGKNVICEKPVEMSVAAFDEMTAAADKSGKLFTVHQNRRWDVDYLAMKKIVESGEIGELINIESRIHGSRGIPSDWRCTKAQGGGMILDWGVHLIDQILQIIKERIVSPRWTTALSLQCTLKAERPPMLRWVHTTLLLCPVFICNARTAVQLLRIGRKMLRLPV